MLFNQIDRKIRDLNHQRIDLMRAFVLKIFKSLLNQKHVEKKTTQGENILVFRLDDKIGDSITSTGFLKSIKLAYPEHRLIVLAGPNAIKVFSHLDFIDDLIISKKGIIGTLKSFFKLSRLQFLYVINTSHILNPRVLFLNRFLKATIKISFLNESDQMFSRHVFFNMNSDHVTERYQAALKLMDIDRALEPYFFQINSQALQCAQLMLKPFLKTDSRLIVLNSFAGAHLRNLNSESTINLVKKLIIEEKNLIVSVGNQNDMLLIDNFKKMFSHERWLSFSDQTDFDFNCALVQLADLVITPDTAFVHLASALKKKLVCIFREDRGDEKNSLIWAPYQTQSILIQAPFNSEKPEDINTFEIEQVIAASKILLSK